MPAHPPINRGRPFQEKIKADGRRLLHYLDEPGIFFFADGSPASQSDAKGMGFDMKEIRKQAKVLELKQEQAEKLSQFEADLEKKTLEELEELDGGDAQKVDPATIESLIDGVDGAYNKEGQLRQTTHLKMRHTGGAKFQVHLLDEDGNIDEGAPLTDKVMGAEAVKFMIDWHADQSDPAA